MTESEIRVEDVAVISPLPSSWAVARLSQIAVLGFGQSPPSSTYNTDGLGMPFFQGKAEFGERYPTIEKWCTAPTRIAEQGDILLSIRAPVGPTNVAPVRCGIGRGLASIRPVEEVPMDYVLYYLRHVAERLAAKGTGTTFGAITKPVVQSIEIPLAPARTRAKIVYKIEQLFSRIDEGERALERVQTLVERYRQSVLRAAVSGELTRVWRNKGKSKRESAEALLDMILKARRGAWEKTELDRLKAKGVTPANDKWKQKYEEPAPPDVNDLPELPQRWAWATVELLCFVETGATPKRGTERYFEGGTINWITSTAVNAPLIHSAPERITPVAIQETNAKVFPVGSLIVAMYGEGKTRGKVSELGIEAATNQACAALLCGHLDPTVKAYLRIFFEKNYAALRAEAAGGVQPNLNLAIIKGTAIPLPPLAEMALINEVVATRMSRISAFASEFPTWARRSTALRQRILCHAFSGALVPQDLSDEPANNLLERIASEHATALSANWRRGMKKKSWESA